MMMTTIMLDRTDSGRKQILPLMKKPRRSGAKVFQQVLRVNSERQPELLLLLCRSMRPGAPRN
jgi:hypothetical protein